MNSKEFRSKNIQEYKLVEKLQIEKRIKDIICNLKKY